MNYLGKYWLGLAVLVSFTCYMLNVKHHPDATMMFWMAATLFFFMLWAFRGFIRFVGRAWHHSVTERQRDIR